MFRIGRSGKAIYRSGRLSIRNEDIEKAINSISKESNNPGIRKLTDSIQSFILMKLDPGGYCGLQYMSVQTGCFKSFRFCYALLCTNVFILQHVRVSATYNFIYCRITITFGTITPIHRIRFSGVTTSPVASSLSVLSDSEASGSKEEG